MSPAGRLGVSLVASAALHVLGLVLVLRAAPPFHRAIVIPIGLVGGRGGGANGPPSAAPPSEVVPAPAPRASQPAAKPRVVRRRAAPPAAASAPAVAAAPPSAGSGEGAPGGAGGGGTGEGKDAGDGTGGARVAYGTNPLPPYPLVARRLGKEGIVLLEVLVSPDGRAAEVRVVRSSGFAPLDESAVTTIRDRWRFLPARRGDVPVPSRVTVPIRFRLDDARG